MEGVSKILTPSAIWKDFNDGLPLKESKINEINYEGISYTEIYFSGRETEAGRVRIYGLYARPQSLSKTHKAQAVLIIPDIDKTVDLELVNHFATQDYIVLMIDCRGDYKDTANHTNYPSEIDYANYSRNADIFKVGMTAKETCWFEWVAVAKYALSYLASKPEIDKIGVIGLRQGGNIGWQLVAGENRVSCFVSVCGIGWQAYKGVYKNSDKDIEMDDERYRWLGGVDAHAYAQYASCPVLYVAPTNSPDFDCDRGIDTLSRVKPEIKCYMNYAPRFRDVVNKKCDDDIGVFLKKYLSKDGANTDKFYFPEAPSLDVAPGADGKNVFAEIVPDKSDKLKSVAVYISEGKIEPSKRNWTEMGKVNKSDPVKLYFRHLLGGECPFVHVFAVAEYKNGVSVSSKIIYKKVNEFPCMPANLLYSSKDGADCFTVFNEKKNSVGKIFFPENTGVEVASVANSICGASSIYGLLTYKLGEKRFKANVRSILKFDIYCEEYTRLTVSVMQDADGQNLAPYSAVVELKGSKVWQNVQIAFSDFKSAERMSIKDYTKTTALKLDAESRFAVNNILLI